MTVHRMLLLCGMAMPILVGCGAPPGEERAPARITRLGDDLLGTGGEVRIADSVAGDVMLSGGDLRFSGSAGGSYLGAGGNQVIRGRIAESVRAAGGNVVLSAGVARNITVAAGNVLVDTGASITHNAYLAGGTVRMRGRAGGSLTVLASEVVLDGTVGGDVQVSAGQLRVGPNARVTGILRHRVPEGKVTIDSGARIGGRVVVEPAARWGGFGRTVRTIMFVGFLVAGAAVVLLLRGLAVASAASVGERAGAASAFGVVWLVGVPLAIVAAAITVVGLPLALMLLLAYPILLYLGRVAVAIWLGGLILRRWRPNGVVAPLASFLVGGVLLMLIGLLPVVGPIVGFIAIVVGAGAVLVTLWPRRQPLESPRA